MEIDPTISMYLAQALHGLAYGMVLFLIASGLTVIYGMMGILNLAHAAFFMLGAYFCYQISSMTGSFWIALFLAPLATAFLGVIIEKFLLQKIYRFGYQSVMIFTLGIATFITGIVKIFWGTEFLPVPEPYIFNGTVAFWGINYPAYRLFVIGLGISVVIMMVLLLYGTRIGKIVRAAASDSEMVRALGINVPLVYLSIFGFGVWLAGIAGVAISPILTVFPGLADQVGFDAFLIVITGGLGSLAGAFVVSLICGLLSSFGVQFFSSFAPVVVMGFMVVVLAIRPQGLFGVEE